MNKRMPVMEYELQFFAESASDKTEEATPKKLEEARKEGQVAKSKEIVDAVSLMAVFLTLRYAIQFLGTKFQEIFQVYNKIPDFTKEAAQGASRPMVRYLTNNLIVQLVIMLAPFFIVGVLTGFIINLVQVKWKPTSKPLRPKFSKMNPLSGIKKIASKDSLFELVKAVFKIGLIAYLAYTTLKDKYGVILLFYDMSLGTALTIIGDMVIDLGIKISAVYFVIGMADFIYQKFKFKKDMRMSKQEVKDEYKNTEGDPQIKGQIRNKMREASQRRMMQALPTADVVITNPTHFAVAVKYDAEVSSAPVVIAKGEDYLAQKIKEAAREHKIEIVENKPLARMLYYNVDIGAEIPPELYQAVAEVLAFVYNLKKK